MRGCSTREKLPLIANPALPSQHFTRHWDEATFQEFREGVHDAAHVVSAAFHDADGEASTKLWMDVFGDKFQVLDEDLEGGDGLAKATFALGAASHARPLSEIAPRGQQALAKVAILARVYSKGGNVPFRHISSGDRVSANRAIKFRAVTNAIGSYDLRWQVVNTGAHAASEGEKGLRGGFFKGRDLKNKPTGTLVNWEFTRYTGRHWAQCFIVRDRVCIAMSDKFFVDIYNPQHG